ncbi:hypothetical protein CBR_g36454 [Chara braunii]|uniref:Uncharacterized protein n=1 Tax=Chara braunii TaxID=69332 RepID=A0A388LKW6_CHABU|nr:hypothetical protein CBR_g36454 [Chara braunii]|eukprot:GBG82927.1 hypothetical protein CBR_g36454 [Chara braunii]
MACRCGSSIHCRVEGGVEVTSKYNRSIVWQVFVKGTPPPTLDLPPDCTDAVVSSAAFAVTSVVAPSDVVLTVAVPGIVPLALSPPPACAVVASVVAPTGPVHVVAAVVVTVDVAAFVAQPVVVPAVAASGAGPLALDRPPEYTVVASVDAPAGYLCFVAAVAVVVVDVADVADVVASVVAPVGIAPQSHALPPVYVVVEVSPDMAPASLALSPRCAVVVASTAAPGDSTLIELEDTTAVSGVVVTAVAGETAIDERFRLPRHAPATEPAPDHAVAVWGAQGEGI